MTKDELGASKVNNHGKKKEIVLKEKGKYTLEDWKKYLNEANQRINSKKNLYKKYRNELKRFMRGYAIENEESLDNAYSKYNEAKSTEFFNKHYEHLEDGDIEKVLKQCKIMVLTANPIEKAILHHHIIYNGSDDQTLNEKAENQVDKTSNTNKIKRIIHENNAYYVFKWGHYWVAHIHQQQTGSYKDYGLFATVTEALHYFKPNVILSIGVAFGIDYTKQKLGDVIVSKELFPFSENKRGEHSIKPDRTQDKMIDSWLNVRFVNSNGFLDDVAYGGVLSSGSVMSSFEEKDIICAAYTPNDFVVGGEMEGSALFQVAPSCGIPCAIIKGICDWGVAKNEICDNEPESEEKNKDSSESGEKNKDNSDSEEENKDSSVSEERFKDSLQAFAMGKAVSKCDILFNDKSLFGSSKMKAVEIERARKNRLYSINIISHFLILAFGLVAMYSRLSGVEFFPYESILIISLITIVSISSMISTRIAVRDNKYKE